MPDEAPLTSTEHGVVPEGDGWFVVNARETRWHHRDGRSAYCDFEGDVEFPHLGINVSVLNPGEALGMYHWEPAQEDFLVLDGEAVLIVEGVERPLRAWDFVHCPPGTNHMIVGAGEAPTRVLAVGARLRPDHGPWGAYTVDPAAQRNGVGVGEETTDPAIAYQHLRRRKPSRYRGGWLPE